MHKQRLAVIIAAGLGAIAAFLPWAKISFMGFSASASGIEGGDGYLSLILFGVAGAMAFLGDYKNTPIDKAKVKGSSII